MIKLIKTYSDIAEKDIHYVILEFDEYQIVHSEDKSEYECGQVIYNKNINNTTFSWFD